MCHIQLRINPLQSREFELGSTPINNKVHKPRKRRPTGQLDLNKICWALPKKYPVSQKWGRYGKKRQGVQIYQSRNQACADRQTEKKED